MSFKIVDFGANRKRIWDSVLVRHIVTLVLSCTVSEILQVFLCSWPHPYSTPFLGVFSLHQIAHVGVSPYTGPKLFGLEIIFQEFQPMWTRYLNVRDRQTDGRTNNILWH